jgi:hypothetical protein
MDDERFDSLARRVETLASRRSTLGALVGAGLVAVLGGAPAEVAAKHKKTCPKGKAKCGKTCCAKGEGCVSGTCVVQAGTCEAQDDSCSATDAVGCNHDLNCECFQRLEGGVRCGHTLAESDCDQCRTDKNCRKLGFPPGSSCIHADEPTCICDATDRGGCIAPCGFVP